MNIKSDIAAFLGPGYPWAQGYITLAAAFAELQANGSMSFEPLEQRSLAALRKARKLQQFSWSHRLGALAPTCGKLGMVFGARLFGFANSSGWRSAQHRDQLVLEVGAFDGEDQEDLEILVAIALEERGYKQLPEADETGFLKQLQKSSFEGGLYRLVSPAKSGQSAKLFVEDHFELFGP